MRRMDVEIVQTRGVEGFLHRTDLSRKQFIKDAFPILLYLFLSPFYLFPSGLPQISDFVLVIGISFVIVRRSGIVWPRSRFVKVLYVFLFNIIMVNLLTSFFLQTSGPVLPTIYYVYNSIVVFFILALFMIHGASLFKMFFWSVAVSTLAQFALIVARMDFTRFRQVGFFNNPNQLGYYSLINLAIIAVTNSEVKTSRGFLSVIIVINVFLTMLSNSKAALISSLIIIVPVFLQLFRRRRFRRTQLTFLIVLLPVLIIVLMIYSSSILSFTETVFQNTQRRLSMIGMDSDDNLTGRGYGRIAMYPEFTLFGAAEGIGPEKDPRYDDPYMGGEIHSTFGTLVFSYGFIGLAAFLTLLIFATDFSSLVSIASVGAISLYSLTHQGLRFTNVWIFLVVSYLAKSFSDS